MSSDSNNINAANDLNQDPDEGLLDEQMEEEPANRTITPPTTGDGEDPEATRANPRREPTEGQINDPVLPGRDGGRGVPGAGRGGHGTGRGGPAGAGRGRRGRGRRHGP